MINERAVVAIKRRIEQIYKAEGTVRIVCDKHTYNIVKDKISVYTFDDFGIYLEGNVPSSYQCCCVFNRAYIPFESITGITGRGF